MLSPDGHWMLSTLTDRLPLGVGLWDCSDGRLERVLTEDTVPRGWPLDFATFLPGGQSLLSTDGDRLWLWSVPNFQPLKSWPAPGFYPLAVSPDGDAVVAWAEYAFTPRRVRLRVARREAGGAFGAPVDLLPWRPDTGSVGVLAGKLYSRKVVG